MRLAEYSSGQCFVCASPVILQLSAKPNFECPFYFFSIYSRGAFCRGPVEHTCEFGTALVWLELQLSRR